MSFCPETVEAFICMRSWYRAGLLEDVNDIAFIREMENASADEQMDGKINLEKQLLS
jgi:hypothetical protein